MPRYDYYCSQCDDTMELVHSISACDEYHECPSCGCRLTRLVSALHVEGSYVYPFDLWNIRLPNGQHSITVNNKWEHKKILGERGFTSPFFSVGG